jgi:ribonucleoside-diphosphate reductase alpha chain
MGFQDALYQLGINFDSEAMVEFSDYSMEVISYHAIFASSKLAAERGTYSSFRGSKWDRGLLPQDTLDLLEQERGVKIDVNRSGKLDWSLVRNSIKQFGMRNSNCMAIAPTATISNISNCVPAMEPIYKNIYVKANQSGDFTIVNEYLVEELKKIGMWNDEMLSKLKYFDGRITQIIEIPQIIRDRFKEVFEVDSKWLIKAAAYRGKWIDQSQSLNIFYSGHSGKDLNDIYLYAWEMGLKTTYYLRTMAATQVEKSTVSTTAFGATHLRKEGESATAPEVTMPQAELAPVLQALANEAVSQNMEDRMEKVEIVVEEEVKPVYLAGDPNATIMIDGKAVKLCKINDPDCEACQ